MQGGSPQKLVRKQAEKAKKIPCGYKIDFDVGLQRFLQLFRCLIVKATAAHVHGFKPGTAAFPRHFLEALANTEIIAKYGSQGKKRQAKIQIALIAVVKIKLKIIFLPGNRKIAA